MGTSVMQEARQQVSDESKGKQVMINFKAMKGQVRKKDSGKNPRQKERGSIMSQS